MMGTLCGELPADEAAAATDRIRRWKKDGRNHRFSADQDGSEVLWPKCTRGKAIPQRMAFSVELSPELGDDRDHTQDCRTCFFAGPPGPRKRTW